MRIEPTVARMLLYFAVPGDALFNPHVEGPLAAQVARVHDDGRVTVSVLDTEGNQHARQRVHLVQEGDESQPEGESYCTWMPYQKGQAAKTDSLEPRVNELDQLVQAAGKSIVQMSSDVTALGSSVSSLTSTVSTLAEDVKSLEQKMLTAAANSAAPV